MPDATKSIEPENEPDLADDMLYGADAIAAFLGKPSRRSVYYNAALGRWPVFSVEGSELCARKSTLRAWIKELEQKGKGRM